MPNWTPSDITVNPVGTDKPLVGTEVDANTAGDISKQIPAASTVTDSSVQAVQITVTLHWDDNVTAPDSFVVNKPSTCPPWAARAASRLSG